MSPILYRSTDNHLKQNLIHSGLDPFIAHLYAARSVSCAEEANDELKSLLPYHSLKNINEMSERLASALINREKITIVADYDADGATACTLGILALSAMGGIVNYVVPNRFENGYGLTPEVVDMVIPLGSNIILTVDNGIASNEGVDYARRLGIEVLVTDHHLPADILPNCLIVNPNQPGCDFPSKNLAGVGVMFYVLMALRAHLRQIAYFSEQLPEPNLATWLDLVALGTVADVVNLDHNNRILVAQGLKRIRNNRMNKGIRALFNVAKRVSAKAESFDLGFALGPRINAAGRLDDMSLGIECLLASTDEGAMECAQVLDDFNKDRRAIEKSIHQEALSFLTSFQAESHNSIVVFQNDWHQGVIGIVASRLKEKYHRPTIVFAQSDEGELRGSGRSIAGFHMRDSLDWISKQQPNLIIRFGGHAMAAGLTIAQKDLPIFKTLFEQSVQKFTPTEMLHKSFTTDGVLPPENLSLDNALKIRDRIWGQGFAYPTFVGEFYVSWQRLVGKNHKKVGLTQGNKLVEAMLFNFTEDLPQKITAVYRLVANEWQQQYELQLYIDYWQSAQ